MQMHSIQYRIAVLLICAAAALVTNPLWHALGHHLSDHHSKAIGDEVVIQSNEYERCPYCDAVSNHAALPLSRLLHDHLVYLRDFYPGRTVLFDSCCQFESQPRAPPLLA